MKALAVLGAAAVAMAGCIPTPRVGTFAPDAVYMVRDHYRISYAAPDARAVLGPDWALENYQTDDRSVGAALWTRDFRRSVDIDGEPPETIERYDLRLSHRSDRAVLVAQTTPVSSALGERALHDVAHELVGRIAQLRSFDIDWSLALPAEHPNAEMRAEGPVTVDSVAGYWTTFDLPPTERVTVVVVRPSARWTRSPRSYARDAEGGWPMLVLFGYVSRIADHAAHRGELEDLLRRVDFHETS